MLVTFKIQLGWKFIYCQKERIPLGSSTRKTEGQCLQETNRCYQMYYLPAALSINKGRNIFFPNCSKRYHLCTLDIARNRFPIELRSALWTKTSQLCQCMHETICADLPLHLRHAGSSDCLSTYYEWFTMNLCHAHRIQPPQAGFNVFYFWVGFIL